MTADNEVRGRQSPSKRCPFSSLRHFPSSKKRFMVPRALSSAKG